MRLRWFFAVTGASSLLMLAAGLGVALAMDDREPWLRISASMCSALLLTTSVMTGVLIANLTFDASHREGAQALRRIILVASGIELLGAVGLLLSAIAAPEATAVLLVITVVSVLLLVGSIQVGKRLLGRHGADVWTATGHAWSPWSPLVLRAKVRRVLLTFSVASLISTGVVVGLDLAFSAGERSFLQWIVYGISIGLLSAAMACIVVSWELVQASRESLGSDYVTQKAVRRVALRNKKNELTEDGQRKAAVYAAIMAKLIPFQLAQNVLLMMGIWLQQLWNLTGDASAGYEPVAIGLVVGVPCFVALFLPIMIRQLRHAQRYADRHAGLHSLEVSDPGHPDPVG